MVLLYLGPARDQRERGRDRTHMRIPANQVRVLEEVAAVNPRVAVLLAGGSAVEAPWLIHCQALLYAVWAARPARPLCCGSLPVRLSLPAA